MLKGPSSVQDLDHNVSAAQFSARRLPEIKSLWRSFLRQQEEVPTPTPNTRSLSNDESYYLSGGRKISSRHLRRRAGSHFRKRHHRFPNGKGEGGIIQKTRTPCRKAKRKRSLLKQAHSCWQKEDESTVQEHGLVRNWLVTHLWHTKRFHMSPPLFQAYGGFCIPLCHNNRDSQAAIRLIRDNDKCTIHDATWTIGGTTICLEVISHLDWNNKYEHDETSEASNPKHNNPICDPTDRAVRDERNVGTRSHYLSLIRILRRFCGHEQPFLLDDQDFLDGRLMGYSMIYVVDSFPIGAMCPGAFLMKPNDDDCSSPCDLKNTSGDSDKTSTPVEHRSLVEIFVPPNLIEATQAMIQELLSKDFVTIDDKTSYRCYVKKGRALLHIRGISASSIIQNTLQSVNVFCPELVSGLDTEVHYKLRHGSVFYANTRLFEKKASVVSKYHAVIETFGQNEIDPSSSKLLTHPTEIPRKYDGVDKEDERDNLILISQCRNTMDVETSRSSNVGCCGWDIVCSPHVASDLFHKFNMIGGTYVIGMVEYAALLMEADPPLPLWPRDYPDTITGKEYWSGKCKEWDLIKYCINHGMKGGRIHTGLRNHVHDCRRVETSNALNVQNRSDSHGTVTASIQWGRLLFQDENTVNSDEGDILLLRGHFGEPLLSIVTLCCYPSTPLGGLKIAGSCRRLRRPVHPPNRPINNPPLPRDQSLSLKESCLTLLKTMSRPALVRCHVLIENKGTLFTNMPIYEYEPEIDMNESSILGYTISGMFSPSRGIEHGVGLISSGALLAYLAKGKHGTCAFKRKAKDGMTYCIRAKVISDGAAAGINVLLSLIF